MVLGRSCRFVGLLIAFIDAMAFIAFIGRIGQMANKPDRDYRGGGKFLLRGCG